MRVPLEVTVELGRSEKIIKEVLELGVGKIITLDANVGSPVDLLVNGHYFAKGQVVVVNEEGYGEEIYGVEITSIISEEERLDKLSEVLR